MKRNDIQFGTNRAGTQSHPHQIITSSHNPSPAIQYVLKNDNNAQPQNIQFAAYNAQPMNTTTTTLNKGNLNPNPPAQVHVLSRSTASRIKNVNNTTSAVAAVPNPQVAVTQASAGGQQQQTQFQRLKVEDALSYLDQVKFKFGNQPQVYNDFLDIMKEFKSQSIDTPGVIQRVSNLFKGHPELIVGFNTFLPPGYKIEVQANDQGYAFQVSVSVPSPSGSVSIQTQPSPQHKMQILQGGGSIIHSVPPAAAVNLITSHGGHPGQGGIHIQPSNQQSVQQQQQQQQQKQQISQDNVSHGGLPGQGSIHIQPSNQTQPSPQHKMQQISQDSVSQSLQHTMSTIIPQNFARNDRERAISQSSQHQQQQQAQQPQTQPLSASQTQAAGILSSADLGSGLQRISQQIMAQDQNQNQPVEFNHAISYVNKIKNRFQNQPEKYKRFLEILHTYQKEQKVTKDISGNLIGGKQLTEAEVYTQVAKLFDNQEDLLREFGQFLPDATSHPGGLHAIGKGHGLHSEGKKLGGAGNAAPTSNAKPIINSNRLERNTSSSNLVGNLGTLALSSAAAVNADFHSPNNNDKEFGHQAAFSFPRELKITGNNMQKFNMSAQSTMANSGIKRSPTYGLPLNHMNREPPIKRHKPICYDVSLAEASKYGTLNDYAFFDRVRQALKSPDVYDNFLRCLTLFNQEIVSKSELLTLVTPFLSKYPDLLRWFQDFLGPSTTPEGLPMVPAQRQDHRNQSDLATEIDLSQCKRLGASYCALPKTSVPKKCSGRTALCREVLNDTWVSFPTWAEDSTFVTSRKTQYEEFIYRCEDERFELDVVIETNSATIKVLEGVQKKLSRMSPEEIVKFKLDDTLGGTSTTIHQRALRRIYGEKANDIIVGLKKNPVVAVPVVLRRLKAKEEEWREAQKGFNKQWREQNEKYYLKSLDHQGINFKQNDIKALRSKSLFNDIETLYDERNDDVGGEHQTGPHLVLKYKDKSILEDAANLLIHHVKRQTGVQKQEKARIKHILRQFVPDLFFSPRQPLSDDERDDDDKDDVEMKGPKSSSSASSVCSNQNDKMASDSTNVSGANDDEKKATEVMDVDQISASEKRRESNDNKCNPLDNKNFVQTSDSASSLFNPATDGKDENPNAVKTEIKEEEDAAAGASGTVKSKAGNANNFSTQRLQHAVSKHPDESYNLFLANNNWYLFFRLHAILCERLIQMYERTQILASEEEQYKSNRRSSTAVALRLKPLNELEINEYYPAFLDLLKNLLDGNVDSNTYEDKLRDMYGIHAYMAFTLDRVVTNAVRQLQHCVTERGALDCVELYQIESRKNGTGGLCRTAAKRLAAEMSYQRRAESSLTDENCFKIFIYKIECRVTIELLDNETEDATATAVNSAKEWENYVERLGNPAAMSSTAVTTANAQTNSNNAITANMQSRKPIFLPRNIKSFHRRNILKIKAETCSNEKQNEGENAAGDSNQVPSSTKNNEIPVWNKNAVERVGQTSLNSDYYVDDNQQIKLNINTYKMIFLSNDFGFYKKNAIRNARKVHPKVTKYKHNRFNEFLNKWVSQNVSDIQRISLNDWLLGRNQTEQIPNKTIMRRDNNINNIPYYSYNRYTVTYVS